MDFQKIFTSALADPQLELLNQGTVAETLQYPLATSFEPWTSMFETIGELPQATHDINLVNPDAQSDSTPVSCTLVDEPDVQFPLSPLEDSASLDESLGSTPISTGLSQFDTSTDSKTQKVTKGKKGRKGRRRRLSESEKREQIKQRNRVAASKCRQKKRENVNELMEMTSSLEARNNDLHQEYQRLRQEIDLVKSDLIQHTECNDPNISRWVENEAKGYVEKLVCNNEQQRMASAGGATDASRTRVF
ncbi:hypothetical protein N5P37_011279 [Trichoderma harzianum]|nr:hypothetical protein N5P37_011279 [Trichoderma harzianum]